MSEGTDVYKLSDYVFCEECFDRNHSPVNKQDHQPLLVSAAANKSSQKLRECALLELFAIMSFINGHYVSFMKVGTGNTTAWLMYDPLAAVGLASRDDGQMFIPEIKHCQEIETWLKDIPASQKADSLPEIIINLTSGLRLCFYRPVDVYKHL